MKIAVIFAGSHFSGKSRTINYFLKPELKISYHSRFFTLDGRYGCILSQSFEESGRNAEDRIEAYSHLDLLVLAARPATEKSSKLEFVEKILRKNKFTVHRLHVAKGSDSSYELLVKQAVKLLRAKA